MCPQDERNIIAAKITKLITFNREKVTNAWLKALGQKWGEIAENKIGFLTDTKKGEDLLSLLLKKISGKFEVEQKDLSPLFQKVRLEEYSILDFLLEIRCLEESIEDVLKDSNEINDFDILIGMRLIRRELLSILGMILKDTSDIYEHVTESGGRGFCQTDTEGAIIYANKIIEEIMGLDSVTGTRLDSYFDGEDKEFVQKILDPESDESQGMRQLHLKRSDGQLIPVGVEIASIKIDREHRGGYAGMVDLALFMKTQLEIFDRSILGIVKVSTEGEFTYLNRSALDACGMEAWKGMTIKDVFPDEKNYSIVNEQLQSRRIGFSDEYEIDITRLNDKKLVPVKVAAIPETDLKGNVVGSMAIVRDVSVERTREKINKHIATLKDSKELLTATAKEVQAVLSYDMFAVTVYAEGMDYLRQMFSYYPDGELEWATRWWQIPDYMVGWLGNKETIIIPNINSLLEQPAWQELIERGVVKLFLKEGFTSSIRCPIKREDRVVGSVAIYSKEPGVYTEEHKKIVEKLRIEEPVIVALDIEERKELSFRLELVKEISSASNNIQNVAETLVERLAEHYDWGEVSLFKVDEEKEWIYPLSRKSNSGFNHHHVDKGQPIDKGVLGHVYKTKQAVNIGNVLEDHELKDIYIPTLKDTLSELCIPVKAGEDFWLLNIEDPRKNAFSKKEMKSLEGVMDDLSKFLERAYLYHFIRASLKYASDGVIIADCNGKIKRANPAILKMLGYAEEEMISSSLAKYLKDTEKNELLNFFLKKEVVAADEATLFHKDGREIDVLLSKSQLHNDFSDKVFFATDLTHQKRIAELEHLGKMFYEIATQTKTPLSLTFSWLNNLKGEVEDPAIADRLEKIIKQLSKAELSFDRLSLYDYKDGIIPLDKMLIDISGVVDNVMDDFPDADRNVITVEYDSALPYLEGDLFRLSFCIKTIISYLLRFVPEDETIKIHMSHNSKKIITKIKGFIPEIDEAVSGDVEEQSLVAKTLAEMALGEKVIKNFIEDSHGGSYNKPVIKGKNILFHFELPAKMEE